MNHRVQSLSFNQSAGCPMSATLCRASSAVYSLVVQQFNLVSSRRHRFLQHSPSHGCSWNAHKCREGPNDRLQ